MENARGMEIKQQKKPARMARSAKGHQNTRQDMVWYGEEMARQDKAK